MQYKLMTLQGFSFQILDAIKKLACWGDKLSPNTNSKFGELIVNKWGIFSLLAYKSIAIFKYKILTENKDNLYQNL